MLLNFKITGLQVLPEWQDYFGHPSGWRLGKNLYPLLSKGINSTNNQAFSLPLNSLATLLASL
jgi:hypothetical protein